MGKIVRLKQEDKMEKWILVPIDFSEFIHEIVLFADECAVCTSDELFLHPL